MQRIILHSSKTPHVSPPPPNKLRCVENGVKSLCNEARVSGFPETHSGKSLGQNNAGNSLSRTSSGISRSALTPASSREEGITNEFDCFLYRIFFSFKWGMKRIVFFFLLKVVVFYLRHRIYVPLCSSSINVISIKFIKQITNSMRINIKRTVYNCRKIRAPYSVHQRF